MVLELISISSDDRDMAALYRDVPDLKQDVQELGRKEVNQMAKLALQAFQSAVPINTGQLSEDHIQVNFAGGRYSNATVYVSDSEHSATPGPDKPASSYLAALLDGRDYNRSRGSRSVGPFAGGLSGSTVGWINDGYDIFLSALGNT